MGYNRENYRRIKQEYDGKNLRAKDAAAARTAALHAELPDLAQIDAAMQDIGMKVFAEAMRGRDGLAQRIERLKQENLELQKARADCLAYHGYPADYTAPQYECKACMDTGFLGTKLCSCMKKALVLAGFESAGIAALMKTQSFETFSLDYYKDDPTVLAEMADTLSFCRKYAADFAVNQRAGGSPNLLLCGHTGLGKTHLSTAIAKVVVENGSDVVYETAQNLMSDFEYERFGRGYGEAGDDRTERYFSCDLLIVDDLGTEMVNQFTVACLYNIINTRLSRRLPMIINTNLTHEELRRRYADRITSRLFGEFLPLLFRGSDIRAQHLKRPNA